MKNYNIDALRGNSTTDAEVREMMLSGRPNMNIPESTLNTGAFVPNLIQEVEKAQKVELVNQLNPLTNKPFTHSEAQQEAHKAAKVAHANYKKLLASNPK